MERRRRHREQEESLKKENLESFKAFLGAIALKYTDAQLIQLRIDMHAAARLLLDLYLLKKQYPAKLPRTSFDNPETTT